jgi:hypothetical protein
MSRIASSVEELQTLSVPPKLSDMPIAKIFVAMESLFAAGFEAYTAKDLEKSFVHLMKYSL